MLHRALGGLLGNLKSGRGLFGEETTQKYARQALEIVEEQVLEVAREIREEEGATQVKKVSMQAHIAITGSLPAANFLCMKAKQQA
jgi:hypothetical protein